MRALKFVFIFMAVMIILTACYFNDDVAPEQVGVQMDRNRILNCVGPGVYTEWGYFEDLREVSANTVTFSVQDPEVATSDNQLVGVAITIQARRQTNDCDAIKTMITNWPGLLHDDQLISTMTATAREAIKNGTRGFTLSMLLNDRNGLANAIADQLKLDARKYSTDVVNVTIENIALDPAYAKALQEKAQYTAEIDKELRRQDLVRQMAETNRLEQEQLTEVLKAQKVREEAQTAIDVEIARREGLKVTESNKVYELNEQAFKLRSLELLAKIFGDKAVMWFIPEGTDLNLILDKIGTDIVPVPLQEGETP